MADEGGVGGGRNKGQNGVGLGGVGGLRVWRNAYGGELEWAFICPLERGLRSGFEAGLRKGDGGYSEGESGN